MHWDKGVALLSSLDVCVGSPVFKCFFTIFIPSYLAVFCISIVLVVVLSASFSFASHLDVWAATAGLVFLNTHLAMQPSVAITSPCREVISVRSITCDTHPRRIRVTVCYHYGVGHLLTRPSSCPSTCCSSGVLLDDSGHVTVEGASHPTSHHCCYTWPKQT